MIRAPPIMEAKESGCPVRSQSTIATMKMVRRAATEESTGDVREMSTRNEPEKAVEQVSIYVYTYSRYVKIDGTY